MNNLLRILAATAFCIICFTPATAQDDQKKSDKYPVEDMSVGTVMTFVNLKSPMFGGQIGYAFEQNMHVGAQLAFAYQSENPTDKIDASTTFYFAPYFKYFIDPIRTLRPFAKASFVISSVPENVFREGLGRYQIKTVTNTNIEIAIGGEWFPYKSVGVFTGFQFFEYQLDRKAFLVGLGPTFIGLEWFI